MIFRRTAVIPNARSVTGKDNVIKELLVVSLDPAVVFQ